MYFIQCVLCFALLLGISTGFNSSSKFFLTTTKYSKGCPRCLNCTTLTRWSTVHRGLPRNQKVLESIYCKRCPSWKDIERWLDRRKRLRRELLQGQVCSSKRIAEVLKCPGCPACSVVEVMRSQTYKDWIQKIPQPRCPRCPTCENVAEWLHEHQQLPNQSTSTIWLPYFANDTLQENSTFTFQQTNLQSFTNGTFDDDPAINKLWRSVIITCWALFISSIMMVAIVICRLWRGNCEDAYLSFLRKQHLPRQGDELDFGETDIIKRRRFSRLSKLSLVPIQDSESIQLSQIETDEKKREDDDDNSFANLRINDFDKKNNGSFDVPITEKTNNVDTVKKVSRVTPLQSPGPEAAKNIENVDTSQLDWNKIFSFLTKIIQPKQLTFLMIDLVDGKDTSVDTIVERIEFENRGISSEDIIFKCLKHWKQLMGNEADPQHIIKAMEERGLNGDAHKFKEFMRNPPTVKSTAKSAVPFHSLCAPENVNLFAYMVTGASNNDSLFNQSTSTRYIAENPTTPIIEEPDDDPRLSRKNYMNNNSPASSDTNFKQSVNRKRKLPIDRLSRHGKRKCKILNKSTYELKQHFKTLRRRKSRKYLRDKIELQKQCIINLIKDPCCLQEVSYKTLMHYAIDCLMKYTNAPEDAIFSLKYTDFEKIQKTSHSENGELYLLHCANTGKFHVFGKDENETLKLYVENARKRRIKELKDSVGKSFVEPEALFLNYKGEPIRTKNVQTNRQCFTSTPSSTSEENSDGNTSLSSTIYVEPESQSDWATCISSDQSYDDSAGSEVLLGSKLLNSMNDDAELTTTSAGQNIASQNISDNNDTVTLNICTNVGGQERNSSSDSAGCVTEIKCANISNDRLQTNAEILSFCLQCIIEERRKLLNKTNRNVDDIELD